jgi:hypothetical protein
VDEELEIAISRHGGGVPQLCGLRAAILVGMYLLWYLTVALIERGAIALTSCSRCWALA